jgi:hypothetical protein
MANKKKNIKETPVEWRTRVLDKKSTSFCGAKWYNATVWLGNGATTSCHHPPPHKINENDVKKDPSALHNTVYKKLVRKQMQEGVRPKECEYCWKIEDMGNDYVSDRYYKSTPYSEEELEAAFTSDWRDSFTPKTLEIAFDSNCNFACSYCNAGYSTTWGHDIKKNGPYDNMTSDGWGAFAHTGEWAQPYGVKNEGNPYTQAFWKWWETDLQHNLQQLRVTGGEATVSYDFWKLINWYDKNPGCKVRLAVNTNLGCKRSHLHRLVKLSHKIDAFDIYTSNEAFGEQAEYIRDGLVYDEWIDNYKYMLNEGNFGMVHCMLTINALCLGSIDKMHEQIFDMREEYNGGKFAEDETFVDMSYNILRFPSFQSITTLPEEVRKERHKYLSDWYSEQKERFHKHEQDGFERTLAYMEVVDEGHSVRDYSDIETRQRDFVSFYKQYDVRRNKNFMTAFSNLPDLVNWYEGYDVSHNIHPVKEPVKDGDATTWGRPIYLDTLAQAVEDQLLIPTKNKSETKS